MHPSVPALSMWENKLEINRPLRNTGNFGCSILINDVEKNEILPFKCFNLSKTCPPHVGEKITKIIVFFSTFLVLYNLLSRNVGDQAFIFSIQKGSLLPSKLWI